MAPLAHPSRRTPFLPLDLPINSFIVSVFFLVTPILTLIQSLDGSREQGTVCFLCLRASSAPVGHRQGASLSLSPVRTHGRPDRTGVRSS